MSREKRPQQARSRATAERLLSAVIRVIDESGLEGATVPAIAAAANVAPASVYRRYADKDDLLRAAFLHALKRSNQNNRRMLREILLKESLESTAAQLIQLIFEQYRHHPLLMRALVRYLDATADQAFVAEARAVMVANLDEVVEILMHHRNEIKRTPPGHALRFAVLNATSAIEAHAMVANSLWHAFPEFTDALLARDFTDSFVAYLRCS